jgi:hypothetical protein
VLLESVKSCSRVSELFKIIFEQLQSAFGVVSEFLEIVTEL